RRALGLALDLPVRKDDPAAVGAEPSFDARAVEERAQTGELDLEPFDRLLRSEDVDRLLALQIGLEALSWRILRRAWWSRRVEERKVLVRRAQVVVELMERRRAVACDRHVAELRLHRFDEEPRRLRAIDDG